MHGKSRKLFEPALDYFKKLFQENAKIVEKFFKVKTHIDISFPKYICYLYYTIFFLLFKLSFTFLRRLKATDYGKRIVYNETGD